VYVTVDNGVFTHGDIVTKFGDAGVLDNSTDKGVGTDFHAEEAVIDVFRSAEGEYLKHFTKGCVEGADDGPSEELWVFEIIWIGAWLVGDIEDVEDSGGDIEEEGDEDDLPELSEGEVLEEEPSK
jgi:hypothetical protein